MGASLKLQQFVFYDLSRCRHRFVASPQLIPATYDFLWFFIVWKPKPIYRFGPKPMYEFSVFHGYLLSDVPTFLLL